MTNNILVYYLLKFFDFKSCNDIITIFNFNGYGYGYGIKFIFITLVYKLNCKGLTARKIIINIITKTNDYMTHVFL